MFANVAMTSNGSSILISYHFDRIFFTGCQALGMENFNISNSQISASSQAGAGAVHAASNGRLHFDPGNINIAGSWSADVSDFDQPWLQVDFLKKITVTKVATQGRLLNSRRYFQWVKTYSLNSSQDGIDFEAYEQFRGVKVILLNCHCLVQAVILESRPCRLCF